MIKLRPYQENAVKELRELMIKNKRRLVMCSPTGSGKTVIFSYMCQRAVEKSKKVLIVTDRIELITQAGGTLQEFGLKPIDIKAGKKLKSFNGLLFTGMAQTLCRRIKLEEYQTFFKKLDLIIFDECHKQSFSKLFEYIPDTTTVIGATATPHRATNQESLEDFYQAIIEVCPIGYLIEKGFLSKANSYGVQVDLSGVKTKGGDFDEKTMGDKYDEIELYHGVYENYMRITPNKKAIIFAPSVSSSKTLVKDFKEKGLPIEHIDGTTQKKERREVLEWFSKTEGAMISNVGILNAGFDQPDLEVVILYRATKSLPLFLQMCGRGSRVTETKKEFTILDFGNNIKRHGFWEEDRVWSLKRPEKKEGEAPIKECPECFALVASRVQICPYCKHEFEKTEKEEKEEVIAELQKLSYSQIKDVLKTADFETIENIASARGFKKGWVYHQLRNEDDLNRYATHKGYNSKWVDYQLKIRENAK